MFIYFMYALLFALLYEMYLHISFYFDNVRLLLICLYVFLLLIFVILFI